MGRRAYCGVHRDGCGVERMYRGLVAVVGVLGMMERVGAQLTSSTSGMAQPICPSTEGDLTIKSPKGISFESLAGPNAGHAVRVHMGMDLREGLVVGGNLTVGDVGFGGQGFPVLKEAVDSMMWHWRNYPGESKMDFAAFQARVNALSMGANALLMSIPPTGTFKPKDKAELMSALEACAEAEVPDPENDPRNWYQVEGSGGELIWETYYFQAWNLFTGEMCTAPDNSGGVASRGVPLAKWDVSLVTDMSYLFESAGYFSSAGVGNWDVSGVTSMNSMFYNSGFSQPIGAWDTSKVEDMTSLFSGSAFNQDISGWNTASVTRMGFMFAYTNYNWDITKWNTSSVFDVGGMFTGNNLFSQDLSSWDTGGIYIWSGVFDEAATMINVWGCNKDGPIPCTPPS